MAPSSVIKCWMCGRAPEQVSMSLGHTAHEDTEVDRSIARTVELKATFSRSTFDWVDKVPDQFRMMDFNFVLGNIGQFKSMKTIYDVEEARKVLFEPLKVAIGRVRAGSDAIIGGVKIKAGDQSGRNLVLSEVDEFEKKMGRHIDHFEGNGALPYGFEGMKLGQGIGLLREVGMLNYSIQQKLLEMEKEDEMSKRPTFGVNIAKVNGLPGEVPVCTICQSLITGLVPA